MTPVSNAPTAEVLLRDYVNRFADGDLDGTTALFDKQALVEIPLIADRAYGGEAIRHAFSQAITSITDVQVTLNSVIGREDLALAEGHLSGTGVNGSPDLDFTFGVVVEAREGLITRLTEYFDTDPILPLGN